MTRRDFLKLVGLFSIPWTAKLYASEPNTMRVIATAYCPCRICCGRHADGKTATGRSAWLAGVAVDPSAIPLGLHLDIPGYNRGPNKNGSWIRADDTGSAIKGNIIDVRFKTHQEAVQWGRKSITVRIWR